MKRLIWGRSAHRDLIQIAAYYRQFDAKLPETLMQRIEAAFLPLPDNSDIGSPARRACVRKWPVRQTPFILLYTLVGGGEIRIQRVVVDARSAWA